MEMKFDKLSNLCDIQIGKTPSRKVVKYWGKGYPWVAISDLKKRYICKTKEQITSEAVIEAGCKLIPKDTLLMSFKLSIGKLAFTTCDLYTNEAIVALSVQNKEEIDNNYLYYALQNIPLLGGAKVAVKGNTLNKKSLGKLKIPLQKNIDDQIKIANLLSQVEALIAKREESINLLDELLRSTFLDMFGDPVLNGKGWDKQTCIDVASCIVPGRDKPKSFTGKIPWITTGDLNHKSFITLEQNYMGLSEAEISDVKAKVIPKGSVIFTCVGDLGIVSINNEDIIMNQQLHSFQCSDKVNNIFMMFNLSFQKQFMYKNASKTTVPYMNKTTCNKIPIILPPKSLQDKFATIVQQVEESKKRYQESLNQLHQLFGSLSQRAFKGELDLSGVEMPVTLDVPTFIRKVDIEEDLEKVESYVDESNRPVYSEDFLWMILSQADDEISYESIASKLEKYSFEESPDYDRVKSDIFSLIGQKKLKQLFVNDTKSMKLVKAT